MPSEDPWPGKIPTTPPPLRAAYERVGYRLVDLPRTSVEARADSGLERLG